MKKIFFIAALAFTNLFSSPIEEEIFKEVINQQKQFLFYSKKAALRAGNQNVLGKDYTCSDIEKELFRNKDFSNILSRINKTSFENLKKEYIDTRCGISILTNNFNNLSLFDEHLTLKERSEIITNISMHEKKINRLIFSYFNQKKDKSALL